MGQTVNLLAYAFGGSNPSLTTMTFTFIYNKYEIAPYAAGEITVDIAVEDIKNILK